MADLDQAAGEALETVTDLMTAVDRAQARFAGLREQVAHAQARLDSEWTALRERAHAFLERAVAETSQLGAAKVAAHGALGTLRAGLEELEGEAGRELAETQASLHAMGTDLEEIEGELTGALHQADEAEESLRARLEGVQGEVDEAMAETEGLLRGALVDDLRQTREEIEQEAVELAATVTSEFVAALEARSRQLFEQLVETEGEIRNILEQAAETTEDAANRALSACANGVELELSQLEDEGTSLERSLEALEDTVSDGRKRLEDRQDRWTEAVRTLREDLRDAQDLLRDVEASLHRLGFV